MFAQLLNFLTFIHRHTGGLEILSVTRISDEWIHRHTGGLEIK